MLPIYKNNNNDPLRQHRSQKDATYGNIPSVDRDTLVSCLLQEQGHLCAYCMCRVKAPLVKVEHWKCREKFPESQLDYNNLLAVCCGNDGKNTSTTRCADERRISSKCKHCDTRKGNKELTYNPADPTHHAKLKIRYSWLTGKIESKDTTFCSELGGETRGTEDVLNLNIEKLRNNRRAVIASVEQMLKRLPPRARKTHIQPLLARWKTANPKGMLPEYAGVAIYFLEKRLAIAQ